MLGSRWLVFPLPSCGDYLPLLAVEDGRLGEMADQAVDQECGSDALDYMMKCLYPNGSYGQ
jgi:hypothetical protein